MEIYLKHKTTQLVQTKQIKDINNSYAITCRFLACKYYIVTPAIFRKDLIIWISGEKNSF